MALSGRLLRISRDGVAIAGARTDNVAFNSEPVDVTDKDDAGWRTMIADVGLRSVSADVDGVLKNSVMISAAMAGNALLIDAGVVAISGIGTVTGDWHIANYTVGGEQADAVTFTGTLESTGSLTVALAPYNTVKPAVTGTITSGQTLTTTNGTWGGDATITYARAWQRNGSSNPNEASWANISGATNLTYVLGAGDVGKYIRCRVTATNSLGSIVAFSNIVGPVAA
jgi:predicted secreted protein